MAVTGFKGACSEVAVSESSAVVGLVAAVRSKSDVFGFDLKFTVHDAHIVVTDGGAVAGDRDIVDSADDVGLSADVRDRTVLGHVDSERVRVIFRKTGNVETFLGKGRAVVSLVAAVRSDRDVDRRDLQRTVIFRDQIVSAYILVSVHDIICIAVIAVIADIPHTGRGRRDRQHVAGGQRENFAACVRGDVRVVVRHRVVLVFVQFAVIRPTLRCGRNHKGIFDGISDPISR